jgi:cytidyltransferase-like protein
MELVPGRVMIFGTFDVFHPGHKYFIEEAMKKGKELIVVIARDVTVKRIKPLLRNSEQVRMQVVQESFLEVKVVLGDEQDPMIVVRKFKPSLVCLGYDQVGFSDELQKNFPEIAIERIAAFGPDKYKSSKMV